MVQGTSDIVLAYLSHCLRQHVELATSNSWLDNAFQAIAAASDVQLLATFSRISRYFGQQVLPVNQTEPFVLSQFNSTWDLSHWTYSQAARTLYLSRLSQIKSAQFNSLLVKLLASADLQESIAIYQGITLLPPSPILLAQAKQGLRSNMSAIFNAIALHNPYPAQYFTDEAWNQMLLKAIFIESEVTAIIGVEQRANPALALMLIDYARERSAANRPIIPILWHLVGLGADSTVIQQLQILAQAKCPVLQQGASLAGLSIHN